jgi:Bacteriophage replication protein O
MAKDSGEPRRFTGFRSPNYTQVPDELFDELMTDLSGAELKVLLYIIRRTFGFKRSSDSISLSQMLHGLQTGNGRVLDRGAGVSKPTLLQALRSLEERNVIETERRRSVEKGDEPTVYRLNFADDFVGESAAGPVVKKFAQGVDKELTPPVVKKPTPQETERDKQKSNSNIRKASRQIEADAEPMNRDGARASQANGSGKATRARTAASGMGMTTIAEAIARRRRQRPELSRPAPETPGSAQSGARAESARRVIRPRQVPQQDEAYQVIQAYIADFRRELNDRAPLRSSTTRAYNLYKRSGLDQDAFIAQLYAARAIVKERAAAIRTQGDDNAAGFPIKHRAGYWFAVLEDLLGLREPPAPDSSGGGGSNPITR